MPFENQAATKSSLMKKMAKPDFSWKAAFVILGLVFALDTPFFAVKWWMDIKPKIDRSKQLEKYETCSQSKNKILTTVKVPFVFDEPSLWDSGDCFKNFSASDFTYYNADFNTDANTTNCSSLCSASTQCIATIIKQDGTCTNYHSNKYQQYLDGDQSIDWDSPYLGWGENSSICGPVVEGFKKTYLLQNKS